MGDLDSWTTFRLSGSPSLKPLSDKDLSTIARKSWTTW
jgi:hypothetical protein